MRAKTTKIWWCQSRFRLPSIPLASAPVKDHPASDSKIWGSRRRFPGIDVRVVGCSSPLGFLLMRTVPFD